MYRKVEDIYGMPSSDKRNYASLNLDFIRQRWDQKAESWEQDLRNEDFHLNEDKAYERFIIHAIGVINSRRELCQNSSLLDVGCGTGLVLQRLIPYFRDATGIDISLKMLDQVRKKNIPNVQLLEGNCFKLNSNLKQFGAIVSRGILLSHYGEQLAIPFLTGIYNMTQKDGFSLIDFLNADARYLYKSTPNNKTYYM